MIAKNLSLHTMVGLAALSVGLASPASAQVTFQWATVGNPGNAADPLNSGSFPGIGSVANEFRIAKHEVTNDQYVEFLSAVAGTDTNGLFNSLMETKGEGGINQSGPSGSRTYSVKANMGNKPVNFTSFFDAMRFVNWLHNGQPTGIQDASTTEDGVYTISDGLSEIRATNALFFLPTQNEWYKAAYYQPVTQGGDSDDYWLYATTSNSVPTVASASVNGDISNPGANVVNYNVGAQWNGLNGNVTTVGSAGTGSQSFYGTSDQSGNLWEWNETLINGLRGKRGGNWGLSISVLPSTFPANDPSSFADSTMGFRVASPASGEAIPTVSQWGLVAMVLLLLTVGTLIMPKASSTFA